MKTERLFYQDAYLREFAARVVGRTIFGGQTAVALDRTAFYPTGGGQPADTGALAVAGDPARAAAVVDVVADDGVIWHVVDGALPADDVVGAVNWDRRFDHMQQHTGQHVLSQAFIQTHDAETVAFHLGGVACTIDLNRTDLGPEALAAAEAAANAIVDRALAVTPSFVEPEALAALPLRKPPKVTAGVRIVQVAGFDWSPCGGTHVANTAQIGAIKIAGAERRGAELRVTFLCGRRARADHARLQLLAEGLVARFTTAQDDLLNAVDRRAVELQALRRDLADLDAQWVESTAAALWMAAPAHGALRVVALTVDYPIERAKRVAQTLRARPGAVICLGVRGERPQLICARADDAPVNAGDLLRSAVTAVGGRGGGRPDWAQGGVPTNAGLDLALTAALAALSQ